MPAGHLPTVSSAKQVAGFISKFDPSIARLTRACRSVIRKRFPSANELVYDNYNALAIGYSPTERTSDVIFSLAVYARGINLHFMHGRSLPDPYGLLQGSGNQSAFIRIVSVSTLDDPKVKTLMDHALKLRKPSLSVNGRGQTIVKSISKKQRPRRSK